MNFNFDKLKEIVSYQSNRRINHIKESIEYCWNKDDGVFKRIISMERWLVCKLFSKSGVSYCDIDNNRQYSDELRFFEQITSAFINMFYDDSGCNIVWYKMIRDPDWINDWKNPEHRSLLNESRFTSYEVPCSHIDEKAFPYFVFHSDEKERQWIDLLSKRGIKLVNNALDCAEKMRKRDIMKLKSQKKSDIVDFIDYDV